jgi:hypothetical protein
VPPTPRGREQPALRLRRHVFEPAPGDQERLGDDVVGYFRGRAPPHVRGDDSQVIGEQLLEREPPTLVVSGHAAV